MSGCWRDTVLVAREKGLSYPTIGGCAPRRFGGHLVRRTWAFGSADNVNGLSTSRHAN